MAATLSQDNTAPNKSLSQIQHLAWIIVLVSFALFCSLSIAFSGTIYYYLFRSTSPLIVTLQVARGSVGLVAEENEQIIRDQSDPSVLNVRPASIGTGILDQAILNFIVPSRDDGVNVVIGSLTLKNSTNLTLENARRPRFEWSDGAYNIFMGDFNGEAELFITDIPDRPLHLRIERSGTVMSFDTVGRYSLVANDDIIRVITYEGRALMISPENRNNRFAVTGEQITIRTGTSLPIVTQAPFNLVDNGLFTFDISPQAETGELQIPAQWGCFTPFEGPPSGEWFADTWNDRQAIRLVRESGDKTSQTGCSRWLDVSVDDYSFLELKATFSVNYQSLINCGVVGSECPMMIFIDYIDAQGREHSWYQSFFYEYDPQNPAPLVCQECTQAYEHRQIESQVWYTYESGNLFSRLPEDMRPVRVLEVRFYASGHQYNVYVSEFGLFAGTEQVIPQIPN